MKRSVSDAIAAHIEKKWGARRLRALSDQQVTDILHAHLTPDGVEPSMRNDLTIPCPYKECRAKIGQGCRTTKRDLKNAKKGIVVRPGVSHFGRRMEWLLITHGWRMNTRRGSTVRGDG